MKRWGSENAYRASYIIWFYEINITGEDAISVDNFIITVYCLVDDLLKNVMGNQKLRQRGFQPSLSDSEMIMMEIVAEFLGIDTDKGAWVNHDCFTTLILSNPSNGMYDRCRSSVKSNVTR